MIEVLPISVHEEGETRLIFNARIRSEAVVMMFLLLVYVLL